MTYPGSRKTVLIGKEITWGTAVTPTKDTGVVQDIADNLAREVSEVMGLGRIEVQQINSGNFDLGGSFTVKAQHGRMFEFILGSVSHAQTTGDWKHTFSVSNLPPSFTLESSEDGTADTNLTHAGCLVESAELSINQTEELMLKIDWKGKTTASSAAAAAAVISSLITFPKSLVTVSLAGAPATELQEAHITFPKKVERSYGTGSVIPQQGQGTELRFQFAAKLGFTNKTYQELFLGGTTPQSQPTGIEFEINADNGVVLGSGQRKVKVTLENCVMNKFDKTAAIGDLIFVDVAGSGTLKEAFSVDNIADTSW